MTNRYLEDSFAPVSAQAAYKIVARSRLHQIKPIATPVPDRETKRYAR